MENITSIEKRELISWLSSQKVVDLQLLRGICLFRDLL